MRTPEHPTPEQANQPQDRTEICRACGSAVLRAIQTGPLEPECDLGLPLEKGLHMPDFVKRVINSLDYRALKASEPANITISPGVASQLTQQDLLAIKQFYGQASSTAPKYELTDVEPGVVR